MEANNMKAMREAVKHIIDTADSIAMRNPTGIIGKLAFHIKQTGDAALAAPPRNCDVGTADEQYERFDTFCSEHSVDAYDRCEECPLNDEYDCHITWAQMPYAAHKEEGNRQ